MKKLINKIISEEIKIIKEQVRKPKYIPNKGLKFIRYGGLTPYKQKNEAAPTKRGLWAFVWPYFDPWFLTGDFSNIHGRFKKSDESGELKFNKNLFKEFYYDGPIFSRIEVPNSTLWKNSWYLTTTKELYNYLGKVYASDIKDLRQHKDFRKKSSDNTSPYKSLTGINMFIDHYEVFIPKTNDPKIIKK